MTRPEPDVRWYAPNRKRPIATSTQATSQFLGALAQQGLTFDEALSQIHHDVEAMFVVNAYVLRGYGDRAMREVGVR